MKIAGTVIDMPSGTWPRAERALRESLRAQGFAWLADEVVANVHTRWQRTEIPGTPQSREEVIQRLSARIGIMFGEIASLEITLAVMRHDIAAAIPEGDQPA